MSDTLFYIGGAVLAMAAATVLTRAFPFLLFARKPPPERLIRAARLIPGAVMVVLVFTSLPISPVVTNPAIWIPWVSVAFTAALHLAARHHLLSIIGGTAFYMILLQVMA